MQNKKFIYTAVTVIFLLSFSYFFLAPPSDFPVGSIVKVERGETLRQVSIKLQQMHLVKSRLAFEAFAILFGREKVVSTEYYFESKSTVYEVAHRISHGETHIAPITVTIPEGFTIDDIADTCTAKLPYFNKNNFIILAKDKEGYLFPDTYLFLRTDTEINVLAQMSKTFNKKISLLEGEIVSSGKNEKEIVTMASIIEKEAKGDLDRGVISGILWHRIALGMPLQVDAAPETYKTRGLPQNPISNPGLEAISAAIHPTTSSYLYYLHDKAGVVHYAKTFTEHQANIQKYLK